MNKRLSIIIAILFAFAYMPAMAQRTLINFDEGWKFHLGNAADPAKDFGCGTEYFNYLTKANSIHNTGPYSNKFDDKDWKTVDLPHDFVVDLPYDSVASHSHGTRLWDISSQKIPLAGIVRPFMLIRKIRTSILNLSLMESSVRAAYG